MSEDKETTTESPEEQPQGISPNPANSDIQTSDTHPDSDTSSRKPEARRKGKAGSSKHFPWAAVTLLLLIAILGAGNYWQFQQGQLLKQSQAEFGRQLSDAAQNIMNLDSQLRETGNKQQSLAQQAQVNEQNQQTLQATLEQMSQQIKELAIAKGKEPLFWKVSEVEYLLSVANHRLLLEKDVNTAQMALNDADKRLKAIGDPGLIPIRKMVADEIGSLKQVKLPDIPGIAAQLNSMASTIEGLPFIKRATELATDDKLGATENKDSKLGFITQMFKDISSGLFTIQRTDEPIEPLLPPEEKQYLKNNLNLKIEQARIALLNQETALFQKNLASIEEWTRKYFDEQDPSVINVLQSVQTLKQVDLQPSLPDISNSLRDLRAWLSQEKQAASHIKNNTTNKPSLASSNMTVQKQP